MFKRNFVKQTGLKDCGPASLLMIIKHYKGYVDIEKLKEMSHTTNKGTTAYHLIEAAKKCGFKAEGFKCELDNLKNIILPCIAHVTINNSYNHFVVIEKIDYKSKKILIKDPAFKTTYYKFDDFNKIFNCVIIQLYPIKKIPFTPKNSILKFIFEIISSSTKELFQIIIMSVFITIFSIITTFYMKYMIDNIIFPKNKLIFIFILFLIVYILKIVSDYLRNKIIILVNQKISLNLTNNTFKQIINLPYCYYRNHTTGEIISRINDLEYLKQVVTKALISLFIDLPLAVIALVVMYNLSSKLFFTSFIAVFLIFLVIILFKNILNNQIETSINNKANLNSYMVEAINGFETIKGCNISNKVLNKFENIYSKLSNSLFKLDNIYNNQYLLKEIINDIGFLIIILVGVFLVIDNFITIGQLISFNSLLTYFLEPIRNIIDLDFNIKNSKIALERILNLYYKKNENYIIDKKMKGDILFNNVSYSYDDINKVLDGVNLKILSKEKVMVIGESGSGKSTLFQLLKKYYKIERNKIFINGVDINDYKNSDIVYVSQNEILFNDTVLNNIDSDNIYDISKICMVDKIVNKNDLGYNMLVLENGFNFSGGERQRIVLARAISRNFDILIIDEGLSQVDVSMEREILNNLFNKFHDKTIIYISHRTDNKDLFNKVVKLKEGKIIHD